MISGVGVDLVHIPRIEKILAKQGLLARLFHEEELLDCKARGAGRQEAASLAARFAAKEAFGKALGCGLAGIFLKDIMVKNRIGGRPELHLKGSALQAFQERGGRRIHLSLSHERDNAIALVVLEDEF